MQFWCRWHSGWFTLRFGCDIVLIHPFFIYHCSKKNFRLGHSVLSVPSLIINKITELFDSFHCILFRLIPRNFFFGLYLLQTKVFSLFLRKKKTQLSCWIICRTLSRLQDPILIWFERTTLALLNHTKRSQCLLWWICNNWFWSNANIVFSSKIIYCLLIRTQVILLYWALKNIGLFF